MSWIRNTAIQRSTWEWSHYKSLSLVIHSCLIEPCIIRQSSSHHSWMRVYDVFFCCSMHDYSRDIMLATAQEQTDLRVGSQTDRSRQTQPEGLERGGPCWLLKTRETREGWPLLTVETREGWPLKLRQMGTQRVQMKGVLPWLVHWVLRVNKRDFRIALAALFSIAQQARSPVRVSGWNWGSWGLKEYKWKGPFLGWFVGLVLRHKRCLSCLGCSSQLGTK